MRAFEQRKKNASTNSSFFSPKIQKKLKTGTPGDQFEVEADKVADKVVNNNSSGGLLQSKSEEEVQQKPISETISSVQSKEMKEEEPVQKKSDEKEEKVQKKEEEKEPVQKKEKEEEKPVQKKEEKEEPIQAKCAECEKEEKVQKKENEEEKPVQKKEQNSNKESQENELEGKLNSSKGSGKGLDKKTKNEMENGFGADFSDVKIHTDTNAVQMSQELGAQAFTNGNDVYFNKGKYNPNSKEGKHLLAHELTHTIQQTGAKQKSTTVQKSSIQNGNSEDLEAPKFQHEYRLEQAHDNLDYLTIGSKGEPVRKVQEGLMSLGYELPKFGADGDFGNETRAAVLDFQFDNQLDYDGIVGEQTIGRLDDIHAGKNGGGKKETPKCSNPDSNLPKMINPFNINDFVLSSGEFLSLGSFKITSDANWEKPHSAKHYHISVIEFIPGTTKSNRIRRRFDVGKAETQTFKFPKDKCVEFKVLVEVINPKTSPNLIGNFSVFH